MSPEYKEQDYHYSTDYRVRSHECDRQGVVHNSRYLEILEVARIEFCRDIVGIPMDSRTFAHHNKFFFVRNAINYFLPAQFDDEIIIYTRAARVGRKRDDKRILEAESVMVYVDEATNEPKEVEPWMRERIDANNR
jgi:YbgC/YbaW family acyl-CoA thioester hydrolase